MEIGQFKEYRGYIGSIEYDSEDKTHCGRLLNIRDLVDYHAGNLVDLCKEFHVAVDNYIKFNEDLQPEKLEKKPDVYIVTSGDYSDYTIRSVFKHRDKAELYCSCHSGCGIEEYDFDDDTTYTIFNVVVISGKVGIKNSKRDYLNLRFEILTEEDDDWKNENLERVYSYSEEVSFVIYRKLPSKYDEKRIREKYTKVFYDVTSEIRYMIAELPQMHWQERDREICSSV